MNVSHLGIFDGSKEVEIAVREWQQLQNPISTKIIFSVKQRWDEYINVPRIHDRKLLLYHTVSLWSSVSAAVISSRNPTSVGKSRDSRRVQRHDKRYARYHKRPLVLSHLIKRFVFCDCLAKFAKCWGSMAHFLTLMAAA